MSRLIWPIYIGKRERPVMPLTPPSQNSVGTQEQSEEQLTNPEPPERHRFSSSLLLQTTWVLDLPTCDDLAQPRIPIWCKTLPLKSRQNGD
jgi:hypothetical protein